MGAETKPGLPSDRGESAGEAEAGPVGAQREEIGDSAVVRIVLRGGDVGVAAIDLIRARLDDPGVGFVPGAADAPVLEEGVRVECDGR